jgi:hypothetical protein
LNGSTIEAHTNTSRFFGAPVTADGDVDLLVRYANPSRPEAFTNIPVLHIGSIVRRSGHEYNITLTGSRNRTVPVPPGVTGVLVSVGAPGTYKITLVGPSLECGDGVHRTKPEVDIHNNETFYDEFGFCVDAAKSKTALMVGISVAGVVVVAGIIVLIVCVVRTKAKRRSTDAAIYDEAFIGKALFGE